MMSVREFESRKNLARGGKLPREPETKMQMLLPIEPGPRGCRFFLCEGILGEEERFWRKAAVVSYW